MTLPLVTCVLTTRDRRIFAAKTLEYIARQTYKPIEVVVIDAGRKKLATEGWHGNVRHVHAAYDITVGASRNAGVSTATGEFIAQWDDDDWWSPRRIERQMSRLEGFDVCSVNDFYVYDVGQRSGYVHNSRVRPRWFSGGTALAHRKVWQQCPVRNITNEEDGFWYQDLEMQKRRIVHWDDMTLYAYVRHFGNGSVTEQRLLKEDTTAEVREMMGEDVTWYDDLSDIAPVRAPGTDETPVLPIFDPRSMYFGNNAMAQRQAMMRKGR